MTVYYIMLKRKVFLLGHLSMSFVKGLHIAQDLTFELSAAMGCVVHVNMNEHEYLGGSKGTPRQKLPMNH